MILQHEELVTKQYVQQNDLPVSEKYALSLQACMQYAVTVCNLNDVCKEKIKY